MKNLFLLFFACLSYTLSAQWEKAAGPLGGYVHCIETVGNELWAGTDGGLYISSDNGATWVLDDLIPAQVPVLEIRVFPGEILVGSVPYDPNNGYTQIDFYRSTDGGQNWTVTEAPYTSFWLAPLSFYREGSRLYCSGDYTWYVSEDDGANWEAIVWPPQMYPNSVVVENDKILICDYGVRYRSTDGGATWNFIDSVGNLDFYSEGDFVIASNYDAMFFSSDFGLTWSSSIANPAYLSANRMWRGADGKLYHFDARIHVSDNNGQSWVALNTNYFATAIDGVQTGNEFVLASATGIWTTTGNGATWNKSNTGLKISKVYTLRSRADGAIWANTNIGLYRSDNGGDSWAACSITPSSDVFLDMYFSGDNALAISDNYIYRSFDGGNSWSSTGYTGSNNFRKIIAHDGKLYLPNYKNILVTQDWGSTFDTIDIDPVQYDWFDDVTFFAGKMLTVTNNGEILTSTNNGNSWTLVKEFWSTGANNGNTFFIQGNKLFVLGRLHYLYTTDGVQWNEIVPQGIPLDQWGTPRRLSNVIGLGNLAFCTVPYAGVFISSDGLQNWQPVNEGLDNLRGISLTLAGQTLFLGTSSGGVWRRANQFLSAGGVVFRDFNGDGVQQPQDTLMANILIAAEPLHSYTSTSLTGTYGIFAEAFSDTLRAVPSSPYAVVNPPFYVLNQPGADYNFGIQFIPDIQDLRVTHTILEQVRPGFGNTIILSVSNVGTKDATATARLILPPGINYDFSFPIATVSGDTLIWNLGLLAPFSSVNIEIEFTASVTLALGTVLPFESQVLPFAGDYAEADNRYETRETVVGSYDPNDKAVRPAEGVTPEQLDAGIRLEYTIRFENTGTFFAEFVKITDTLSPAIDPSSIQILASSHTMQWSLRPGRVIEFSFPNIFLWPSGPGIQGHGFVKFSVQCLPGLEVGDQVFNTADIFFDFNTPIRTNTVETQVKTTLPTWQPALVSDNLLQISPNPAREHLQLRWKRAPGAVDLTLTDASGRRVWAAQRTVTGTTESITLPALPAGLYFLGWRGAREGGEVKVEKH